MRFLFVDSIEELGQTRVRGTRTFGLSEPLRYAATPRRGAVVAPGAVSEAIGQLASWLCLQQNDFTARPVFLFADAIEVHGFAPLGAKVMLDAEVTKLDAETFTFSGKASVEGRVIQSIDQCSGYFMPLSDLEDPAETRRRFEALVGGGLKLAGAEGPAFDFTKLAGEVAEVVLGERARAHTVMAIQEPFYRDHFPRFPVTPIVVLNEMIGAVAKQALGDVRIRAVRDVKIKAFVRPGDTCETRVVVQGRADGIIQTVAEIIKDGRRILRGVYEFESEQEGSHGA